MIFRSKVLGGVIAVPPDVRLPDGTGVIVELDCAATQPRPLAGPPSMRNGVPVFPRSGEASVPDVHVVNELRDETP
jgi:hypothetical protein